MADYDWFRPSEAALKADAAAHNWLKLHDFTTVSSDDIHSSRLKLGCKLFGAVLIGSYYLDETPNSEWAKIHRGVCFRAVESYGKHKA